MQVVVLWNAKALKWERHISKTEAKAVDFILAKYSKRVFPCTLSHSELKTQKQHKCLSYFLASEYI